MVAKNDPSAIRITRVYDAPVQVVWDAWTDPEQAAKWWGPRGFTITTHSKDLRPGGIWWYTMHGPDGTDYPNKTLYHEVEECKKLVYDHGAYDERAPLFRVTVLFCEADGKTTMEMSLKLPTAEEAAAMRKFIKDAGGNATWDRLAEYLNETQKKQASFVVNRCFEAPRDWIFELWTDPAHLTRWLPPEGFEMEILSGEIREGGSVLFRMTNRADVTFYGQFEYRELSKPGRIVYLQRFCDEHGRSAVHPALPAFPEALRNTVVFVEEDKETTRVTVTSEPFGAATPDEISSLLNVRGGMTEGWTGSFDKLEEITAMAVKVE